MRLEGLHVPARKRHTEETGRSDEPGPPGALLTAPWSTGTGNIRLSIPQASSVISLERSGLGSDGAGRTDGAAQPRSSPMHFFPVFPGKPGAPASATGPGLSSLRPPCGLRPDDRAPRR